jgi:hypothetical protein
MVDLGILGVLNYSVSAPFFHIVLSKSPKEGIKRNFATVMPL